MMKNISTLKSTVGMICIVTFLFLSPDAQGQSIPRMMPQDLEIALAKSALPGRLRDGATVYVLKSGEGYVKAVVGTNGYSCFVERPALEGTIAPIAFDTEGTRVMIPPRFDKAKLIQQGQSQEDAQAVIDAGFKSGKYLPPSIGGLSYMLSPLNILPRGQSGKPFVYYPHFMIYSPYVTNEAIESKFDMNSYLPFVTTTGPHGLIVIPVGETERRQIKEEHKELIARYEAFVGAQEN